MLGLFHQILLLRHRRDLREMGHAEHLLRPAEGSELFCHPLRRDAGYAGVDLVKDQRVYAVLFGKDVLEREHDARKLAAGSNAADRAKRFTGVRRHDEAYLIRAGGRQGVFPFAGKKPHLKADRRHAEIAKLADDALLEPLCRSLPEIGERACLLFGKRIRLRCFLFQLREPVARVFQLVETALGIRKKRSEPFFVCGIFLFQTPQLGEPFLQPVIFLRGKVQKLLLFAQPLGSVLQRESRRADDLFGLRKIGAPRAGTGNIILRIAALCNSAAV